MAAPVTDPRPPAPPTGSPRHGGVTRDEERREAALHIAALTFQSAQGLDLKTTERILERAKIFEDFIAGG